MDKFEQERMIEMAWEDHTPFEAIKRQFDITEDQCIKIMRKNLSPSSFKLWRKRVYGRKSKHEKNADEENKQHLKHRAYGHNKLKSKTKKR